MLAIVLLFSITGCGNGQVIEPTITSSPTITLAPTRTHTYTPSPTITPTSTPTIEPPTEMANLLEGVVFTNYESFAGEPSGDWTLQDCQKMVDGVLVTSCPIFWNGYRAIPLNAGEGVLIDYKYENIVDNNPSYDGYLNILLVSGVPGPDSTDWQKFGVNYSILNGQGTAFWGWGDVGCMYNDRQEWTKVNTWYRLALAVDKSGKALISVWEQDKSDSKVWIKTAECGSSYVSPEWHFSYETSNLTLYLDNFYQFTFDQIIQ